eukprot:NODE_1_length_95616_cov_0.657642.p73 type:complete len:123 gc:universal NODE_1_length_95616_cov_0.657642:19505-19873(+)
MLTVLDPFNSLKTLTKRLLLSEGFRYPDKLFSESILEVQLNTISYDKPILLLKFTIESGIEYCIPTTQSNESLIFSLPSGPIALAHNSIISGNSKPVQNSENKLLNSPLLVGENTASSLLKE